MVTYSIPICNYNMADTVAKAVQSIHEQVTDEYEVFLVDDGSTDDSRRVLTDLEEKYGNVRTKFLSPDPERRLGETRNISIAESAGDYVFTCMDADDVYYRDAIQDFADIYHQIERQVDYEFYLKGESINMAPKSFLLEYGPYRNLPIGGEDRDLWRRLFADEAIIWLKHEPFWCEIGYEKDILDRFRRDVQLKVGDFQVGIDFASCYRWSFRERPTHLMLYDFVTYPVARVLSRWRTSYESPDRFRIKGSFERAIESQSVTLRELDEGSDIDIDVDRLSRTGREVYYEYER